jgi:hypothetical protein
MLFLQKRHHDLAKRSIFGAIENIKKQNELFVSLTLNLQKLERADSTENQKIFKLIQTEFDLVFKLFEENKTLLADLQGRMQIDLNIVGKYEELKNYVIDPSQVKTGDFLMSFTSKAYVHYLPFNFPLHKIIQSIVGSGIVHVAMGIKINGTTKIYDMLTAGGAHIRDFVLEPGEVYVVLRPRLTQDQRMTLLNLLRTELKQRQYSILKLVGAGISTIIGNSIQKITKGHVRVPNFLKFRSQGYFCSAFFNEIFLKMGILLTPKSRDSDLVSPSDIVASPFVDYIGLIFRTDEKSEEIIRTHMDGLQI